MVSSRRNRRSALAVAALALAALAPVVASGASVTTQTADVRGQGAAGPVVADDGATLQRSDSGLTAHLSMPTPAPGTYSYPPANALFPAAVPGHPEAYSLWVFVFNFPNLCSTPCDGNDLGTTTPAMGGAFNGGGHVVGGPTLTLDGHVSLNTAPFGGSMLLAPRTAEVHFAVAPHGEVRPALLPDQISKPIGSPPFWWIATFQP